MGNRSETDTGEGYGRKTKSPDKSGLMDAMARYAIKPGSSPDDPLE